MKPRTILHFRVDITSRSCSLGWNINRNPISIIFRNPFQHPLQRKYCNHHPRRRINNILINRYSPSGHIYKSTVFIIFGELSLISINNIFLSMLNLRFVKSYRHIRCFAGLKQSCYMFLYFKQIFIKRAHHFKDSSTIHHTLIINRYHSLGFWQKESITPNLPHSDIPLSARMSH